MGKSGWAHTEEAKLRIGDAKRGKTCPPACACWKHSPETRRRQSEAANNRRPSSSSPRPGTGKKCLEGCACGRHRVSAEAKKRLSENRRARTPEQEERRIDALRKRMVGSTWPDRQTHYTPEERQRRSDLLKKMWEEGRFDGESRPYFGRSAGLHAGVRMRCLNTEGVFAQDCEALGITWQYEPRRFKLSWCTYTPDFYLPEFDIWIEVKGHPGQGGNWAQKIETFRQETGKTIVIVFHKELSSSRYRGGQN